MDNNFTSFISWLLIVLAFVCIKHIDLNEASFIIHPSQRPENSSLLQTTNIGRSSTPSPTQFGTHLYAGYKIEIHQGIFGVHAKLNIWAPYTKKGDYSATVISLSGMDTNKNQIYLKAGWMVNPLKFGDAYPRYFASYKRSINLPECYSLNQLCTGFVVTRPEYFTNPITKISFNREPYHEVDVQIIKNNETHSWSMRINNIEIGYWKANLMMIIDEGASSASWGGEVYVQSNQAPLQSATSMGSGKFPEEGEGRASYIREVQYINDRYAFSKPNWPRAYTSNKALYRVSVPFKNRDNLLFFYYGGSGQPS